MLGVLLGAGFSKWAANLPLAFELFDFDLVPRNDREQRRLLLLRKDKDKWDFANPSGQAEEFVEWSLNKSAVRSSRVIWYLTRRLSDPFIATILGGTQTLMIDDRRARELLGVKRAQDFLRLAVGPHTSGVLTTNYDLLIEYALTTKFFNYGRLGEHLTGRGHNPQFPWQNTPVTLSGATPLAKLHGSVSWQESIRFTDGRCGLNGKALIVAPRADKNGEDEMPEVWNLARKILARSTRIIVFGFAFNPYDRHLLQLLSMSGGAIRDVALVDPSPALARAASLWPKATINAFEAPSTHDTAIRKWLEAT